MSLNSNANGESTMLGTLTKQAAMAARQIADEALQIARRAGGVVQATLPTFVFQPGGATANNVFATELELRNALRKVQGQRVVELDFHLVGNVGTIGTVPWTLMGPTSDIVVRGNGFLDPLTSLHTQVTIANGANFNNDNGGTIIQAFEDLTITGPSAGTEPVLLDNSSITFRNCQYIGGGVALIRSTVANGGFIELWDTTSIVTGPFYNGKDTSFTTIVIGNDGALNANTLIGDVGASVDIIPVLGTGIAAITHVGFLGTIIVGPFFNPVSGPLRFISSPTPTQAGDVGMNLANGHLRVFTGGASSEVPAQADTDSYLGRGTPDQSQSFLRTLTVNDNANHVIATLDATAINTGTFDISGHINIVNTGATGGTKGDVYQADFDFKGVRLNAGAIAGVNGTSPSVFNVQPSSGGTYALTLVVNANNVQIDFKGNTGETVKATLTGQLTQSVSTGTASTVS